MYLWRLAENAKIKLETIRWLFFHIYPEIWGRGPKLPNIFFSAILCSNMASALVEVIIVSFEWGNIG